MWMCVIRSLPIGLLHSIEWRAEGKRAHPSETRTTDTQPNNKQNPSAQCTAETHPSLLLLPEPEHVRTCCPAPASAAVRWPVSDGTASRVRVCVCVPTFPAMFSQLAWRGVAMRCVRLNGVEALSLGRSPDAQTQNVLSDDALRLNRYARYTLLDPTETRHCKVVVVVVVGGVDGHYVR